MTPDAVRAARRALIAGRASAAGRAIWRHKGKIALGTVVAMPVLGLPALSVVAAAQTVAGAGGAAIASPVATAMTAAAGLALRNRVRQYRKNIAATTNGGNEPPRVPPTSSDVQPAIVTTANSDDPPNQRASKADLLDAQSSTDPTRHGESRSREKPKVRPSAESGRPPPQPAPTSPTPRRRRDSNLGPFTMPLQPEPAAGNDGDPRADVV